MTGTRTTGLVLAGVRKERAARVGAPLAVLSLVLLVSAWVFAGSVTTIGTASTLFVVLGLAIVTFLAAAAMFLPRRRRRVADDS